MNEQPTSISQLGAGNELDGSAAGGGLSADDLSLLRYLPDYLTREDSDRLYSDLKAAMPWTREQINMYGRTIPVPRRVAWCGDSGIDYRYSGLPHVAQGWTEGLSIVRDQLELFLDRHFNFALLNRYGDGGEYMGWHRDDEPGIGDLVASISLGASRRFLIRPDAATRSTRLDLTHGSLLVFKGSLRHALPRAKSAGERLNITFRTIRQNTSR
jgi:alkylated DNA repair dioxygenase AlkB